MLTANNTIASLHTFVLIKDNIKAFYKDQITLDLIIVESDNETPKVFTNISNLYESLDNQDVHERLRQVTGLPQE